MKGAIIYIYRESIEMIYSCRPPCILYIKIMHGLIGKKREACALGLGTSIYMN